MKIDNWFKPAILLLSVIFLLIFFLHTLNGRYRPMGIEHTQVLDTFTGKVYNRYGEKLIKFNPKEVHE